MHAYLYALNLMGSRSDDPHSLTDRGTGNEQSSTTLDFIIEIGWTEYTEWTSRLKRLNKLNRLNQLDRLNRLNMLNISNRLNRLN